jgi:two-component system, OmpR family, sensor kinase
VRFLSPRARAAIAVGVVALLVATPLAWLATSRAIEAADDDAHETAEWFLSRALVRWSANGEPSWGEEPVWFVDRVDRSSWALFDNPWVEPPVFQLTEGEGHSTFRPPNGPELLTASRQVDDRRWLVTVVGLEEFEDRASQARWQGGFFVVVMAAFGAVAGWLLGGRALEPARRALADRQGFLADAAHEMRTPLAVIQASASQSLARPRTGEEYVRSLSEIRAAAERAATGVGELLDLARFDSGQAIPRLAPLRLDLLAEEVAASGRDGDAEVVAEPGDPVVVDADMPLLRQAVENVVRNAARRATEVRMRAWTEGRDGVLEVADNGPGFDPALLPHVFDRYRRGDRQGGAGLGLAIVHAVVAAHGGRAEAANADGGGAIVRLRVPLTRTSLS